MTVIAWKDGVLAADRLMLHGATRKEVTKIHRVADCLAGVCGTLSIGMEMLAWYRAGAIPGQYPTSNRNPSEGASLIVVRPDGTVWNYESSPHPFLVEGPFCAFGSGDEPAMVAMYCGKSAAEAVEIAGLYNNGCGNGVDTLTL